MTGKIRDKLKLFIINLMLPKSLKWVQYSTCIDNLTPVKLVEWLTL